MLDFTEVGLLDFSCADEIVAKLLLDTDPGIDRYVMLLGTREDHTEAIDHVLNHHALAIATPNRCAHCGAAIRPHRVCDNCGHYGFEKGGQKGVAVFEKESV